MCPLPREWSIITDILPQEVAIITDIGPLPREWRIITDMRPVEIDRMSRSPPVGGQIRADSFVYNTFQHQDCSANKQICMNLPVHKGAPAHPPLQ